MSDAAIDLTKVHVSLPGGEPVALGGPIELAPDERYSDEKPWVEPIDLVHTIVFDEKEIRRIKNAFKRMFRKHRSAIRNIDKARKPCNVIRSTIKARKRSRNNTHQKRFKHGRTYRTR